MVTEYFKLTPEIAKRVAALTFPTYRNSLSPLEQNLFGCTALINDQPCALILWRKQNNIAEILSVFVQKEYREMGIGKKLIQTAIEDAKKLKCQYAKIIWTTRHLKTAALEALLATTNWEIPVTRVKFFESTTTRINEAPWLWRFPDPVLPYQLKTWELLSNKQLDLLLSNSCNAPETLAPNFRMEHVDPTTSSALLFHEEVVGWMIVHDFPEMTNRLVYSRSWCTPNHRNRGRGAALILHSIRAHILKRSDRLWGIFDVSIDKKEMLLFFEKRFKKYAESTFESRQSVFLIDEKFK
jgi:GNAT superfamily N-acetyltransferase